MKKFKQKWSWYKPKPTYLCLEVLKSKSKFTVTMWPPSICLVDWNDFTITAGSDQYRKKKIGSHKWLWIKNGVVVPKEKFVKY